MKAKLIKTDSNNFVLETNNGFLSGTLEPSSFEYRLSLKNCQAIERGYDLDELAWNQLSDGSAPPVGGYESFIRGFRKALEILGDKKFSEEDIIIAMTCMQGQEVFYEKTFEETQKSRESYIKNYIQSLQQTEWDCIVEMEGFVDEEGIYCGEKPKLDADGCLILKRK